MEIAVFFISLWIILAVYVVIDTYYDRAHGGDLF
jgi:hypothetical protein